MGQAQLRARQRFGKYIIERKLAEGGFAIVYRARDTIEGVRVALKVPFAHLMTGTTLEYLKREVRLAARLQHPNIQPLKYADYIEGQFVIVGPLGEEGLDDRLKRRISLTTALDYAQQMIAAVAHAHEHRIIHCDIKPENFLIYPGNRIKLTDFGIARVAHGTLRGSGTGTVGYVAPEQAMGKPSFRSDVFALGVVLYRMLSGHLPEWPYEWPPPGYDRLRRTLHPDLIALLRRSIEVDTRKRYADAGKMLAAFTRVRSPIRPSVRGRTERPRTGPSRSWRAMRSSEFKRRFGKALETRHHCAHCEEPVSEPMQACPWCGKRRRTHPEGTTFPKQCPRCLRGMKADWRYCAWCFGPGFEPETTRDYPDRRYSARCPSPACSRKQLMPFMRYCPWCRRKVRRRWTIEGSKDRCGRCGWGVLRQYWSHCPWCTASLKG